MRIFDLHSDIFTDIAQRKLAGEKDVFDRIHYPKLKKGGVDTLFCVFWVEGIYKHNPYERFQSVFTHVLEDLKHSKHAFVCDPHVPLEEQEVPGKIRILLGLEGLSFIQGWRGASIRTKIENAFHDLQADRVHHAIFVWNEHNFLCTGTGATSNQAKGLTEMGEVAVREANKRKYLLDVSHLDVASFWDMYRLSQLPLFASHSNAKAVCDHERNLTDEQIKAIAEKGGIIGLNAHADFVDKHDPTVDCFIDHAIYITDLVGYEHVAFGFDFLDYMQSYDLGGNLVNAFTKGLEDVSKVPELLVRMQERGFTEQEVQAICFHNAFRFISRYFNPISNEHKRLEDVL
ncbi:dipeptidase [Virgibacillus sp. W0430]|uniref:dipeptidase n=1 Tax=Virgibacillus sp. W0430 TaxID=3391580 RepID=UPI003F485A44